MTGLADLLQASLQRLISLLAPLTCKHGQGVARPPPQHMRKRKVPTDTRARFAGASSRFLLNRQTPLTSSNSKRLGRQHCDSRNNSWLPCKMTAM